MRKNHFFPLWLLLVFLLFTALPACSDEDASAENPVDGDTDASEEAETNEPVIDGDEEDASESEGEEAEESFTPPACKTPSALPASGYFTNVTDEWKLGDTGIGLTGRRFAAVDLNLDGYPDLVVHEVNSNKRDDLEADPPVRHKRVLLNQQNPVNPMRRIFVDITEESGYAATRDGIGGRSCQFAVFGDFDNNDTPDCFSATYVDANNAEPGDRSEILFTDGEGHFSLVDKSDTSPGFDELWTTTGASLLDYDRDGNLDIWVGFFYKRYGFLSALQNRLYKGNGDGSFTDVTIEMGLETLTSGYETGDSHRPTYGITTCDVNDDGNMDLLASSYGRQFNELWLYKDGAYVNQSLESGFASDDIIDYTDNQFYACYCTLHECDPDPGRPRVVCPDPADAYWSSSDEEAWRLGGNTFTTLCGDFTDDGLPDLFNAEIVHWHIGQSSDPSQILVNESTANEARFTRPGREAMGLTREHVGASWNEGDLVALRFDFDNDGFPDLYVGNSDYPDTWGLLYRRLPDGTFENVTDVSGAKHDRAGGMVYADFDRDGDLDLLIGSSTARESPWEKEEVHLYRNDVGQNANAIRLTLVGKGEGFANRFGIGARVKVTTGEHTQTEWVQGGFGHFGIQPETPLTIGLGEACTIDELEIRWPNADLSVQTFTDIPANVHVIIHEGESEPEFQPLAL